MYVSHSSITYCIKVGNQGIAHIMSLLMDLLCAPKTKGGTVRIRVCVFDVSFVLRRVLHTSHTPLHCLISNTLTHTHLLTWKHVCVHH